MTEPIVSALQNQYPQYWSHTSISEYLRAHDYTEISEDGEHVVLSRRVLESLPLTTQQHAVYVLQQTQNQRQPETPVSYRVTPLRWAPIHTLDAATLAEVDITSELGNAGDLAYYDHRNQRWIPPEETSLQVLVSTDSDDLCNTSTRRQ